MRIVVLDGYTLNPGDLSWEGLQALGECAVYDRTPPAQVVLRAQGAESVFTNKTVLDAATLQELPKLRYIGVLATGYNVVDVRVARERNLVVTNIPTYGTRSVAQHVFALLLELTQHVGHHANTVRDGRWSGNPDWCYWDHPLIELEGLTMGIVGFGRIGQTVATLASAFGMKVLAYDLQPPPALPPGVRLADFDAVFAQCGNLLVPVCVSASHIAFGSIRMEPVFMILGQSAVTAASLAIDRGCTVQDVPYLELRKRLLADGQVLELADRRGKK